MAQILRECRVHTMGADGRFSGDRNNPVVLIAKPDLETVILGSGGNGEEQDCAGQQQELSHRMTLLEHPKVNSGPRESFSRPALKVSIRKNTTVSQIDTHSKLGYGLDYAAVPQHFLYFLPLPQGQGSLRPTLAPVRTGLGASACAGPVWYCSCCCCFCWRRSI